MSAPNPWMAHGAALYGIVGFGLFIFVMVYLPCLLTGDYCPQ